MHCIMTMVYEFHMHTNNTEFFREHKVSDLLSYFRVSKFLFKIKHYNLVNATMDVLKTFQAYGYMS